MLQIFQKNDMTVYFKEEVSFAQAFEDQDIQLLRKFMHPIKFYEKILMLMSELKEDSDMQKEFIIWSCGTLSDTILKWCFNLKYSGKELVQNQLNRIRDFYKVLDAKAKGDKNETKRDVAGDFIVNSNPDKSDIYDWIEFKMDYKNFTKVDEKKAYMKAQIYAAEYLKRKLTSIKDNLPYTDRYRNTYFFEQIEDIKAEIFKNEEKIPLDLALLFEFLFNETKSEIITMNFFWRVIEELFDRTNFSEINPEDFGKNFFSQKIHLFKEIEFSASEDKTNIELSIPQKLRIVHDLKFLDLLQDKENGFDLSNRKTSTLLAAIFGTTPGSVKNELTYIWTKRNSKREKATEDRKTVNELYRKVGLNHLVTDFQDGDK